MQICCTKKLLTEMKIVPDSTEEEAPLFRWSVHLIIVNRRKTIVVVNDSNRFAFILHGLKAKDLKNLDTLILQGIKRVLLGEKIKVEVVEKYLETAGTLTYTKTKGAQYVSRLNRVCELVNYCEDTLECEELYQSRLSLVLNGDLVKIIKGNDYEQPYKLIIEDLKKLYGEDIISCEAVNLIVKLNLEKDYVIRKILTPLDINFKQLHEIIQAAFDWKNAHLHDFKIFDETGKFITNIVSEEEEIYEVALTIKESETKLSQYFDSKYKIIYCYDFGDNWEHEIIFESKQANYDENYPICLEGKGNTPPENVGGAPGYENFLEVMADSNHPEYEQTKAWLTHQRYREFDLEFTNRRLKGTLRR